MNNNLKRFIKNYFFVDEFFAGWESIADSLLESGECIVAGNGRIWIGGIGDFIKVSTAPNLIGCSILKFDIAVFLSSELFKHTKESYLEQIRNDIEKLEMEYEDIA